MDQDSRSVNETAKSDDCTNNLVDVTDVHTGEPCGDPEFVAAVSKALHKAMDVEHDVVVVQPKDSLPIVFVLHHLSWWLVRTLSVIIFFVSLY